LKLKHEIKVINFPMRASC